VRIEAGAALSRNCDLVLFFSIVSAIIDKQSTKQPQRWPMPLHLLFIHNNFPGQFYRLLLRLRNRSDVKLTFISSPNANRLAGIRRIDFEPQWTGRPMDDARHRGLHVLRIIERLLSQGEAFDAVLVHSAFGDALFLRLVLPRIPILNLPEFYVRAESEFYSFVREYPVPVDVKMKIEEINGMMAKSILDANLSIVPTNFQRDQFPDPLRKHLVVLHEGIDDQLFNFENAKSQTFQTGLQINRGDEVVSFMTRSLEPIRGYHTFVRAAEIILKKRDRTIFVVAGNEASQYVPRPKGVTSWRAALEREAQLPSDRYHFVGLLERPDFVNVLRLATAHVYLTAPFVLSWSMLEAMAAGGMLVASDTEPVREFVSDGVSGILTDFHDPSLLATRIESVLDGKVNAEDFRRAARTAAAPYAAAKCTETMLGYLASLLPSSKGKLLASDAVMGRAPIEP
jgi:glycosyltransferase involved in cell wall biosynthesis